MGRTEMTVLERFEEKYTPEPNSGCWLWTGCTHKTSGYGGFGYEGKKRAAHRVSWMLYRGEIPEGLEIDHLCRTRNCVNPAHLEPVTPKVNRLRGMGWAGRHARKTHCPKGHLLVLDLRHAGKRRWCPECFGDVARRAEKKAYGQRPYVKARQRESQRAYKARLNAARVA